VAGRQAGILTLACDLGKGALPVILANLMEIPQGWIATVCLAAVLGHAYSPWLRFRGGKGVATAAGTFLIAAPMAIIICLVIFALALKLSKRISVGSLFSVIALPFILHTTGSIGQMTAAGAIVAVLVIIKHTENIKRLLAGNEPKFTS
jgi:glycerol-3-phosphate acyltransferase PlsY